MLYEWLNRSHIVEWWGGEEARPTLADVQEQYLPSVLAQESVTPYIAMLNGEPIGYAVRCSWKRGRMVGRRNRSRSTRTSHWRMHHNWAKAWGTKLVRALVELLFNDPEVTKIQTDRRRATCERSDATRKRGLRGKVP